MKLTDIQCRTAKGKEKKYKLSDGGGMFLDVRPNGSKYWRMKYRFHGKEKLLSLGVYPDVSLAEAREKRANAKKVLAENKDPSLEKQKKKALSQVSYENTFESVGKEWFENRQHIWKPRYRDEVKKRLEQDIYPHIGHYPITDIEPTLLLEVIRKIERRGAYDLAKRQLQKCGEIFKFAIAEGKIPPHKNPTYGLNDALKPTKKTHFASIDVKDLPELIDAIERNDARLYQSTRNALKLMMLTFVRTSELINAKWEEIDFENKEWVIPAERMKMGKVHIVPLADQAIEILKDQKTISEQWPLVFPSSVKPRKSISNNTILGALKRLGFKGRMTGHGFRSLAMGGIKQELGYRHEVIDRQLAHTHKSKIDKAYDRAQFLDERKKMMQDWADYIDGLKK